MPDTLEEIDGLNFNNTCQDGVFLQITHAPTGKRIQFKQIKMTGFSDTVTPNWNEEVVYGRMDPIATFQGTTRAIELSFELGPFSESDERKLLALQKVTRLMQFQYPTYSNNDSASATAIARPPLVRVQFANYIVNDLLCYMSGMSYTPVDGMSAITVPKIVDGKILPQRIAVSISLKVLHETAPGWGDESKEWSGAKDWGPIGVALVEDTASLDSDDVVNNEAESEQAQMLNGDS